MPRLTTLVALVAALSLTAGCANSVLNDPEEMARRQADVDRQTQAWNRYWSSGTSVGSSDSGQRGGDGSSLSQGSATTPSACRAIGGTWNTGSGFCWRL
jgi:hypothetical protein